MVWNTVVFKQCNQSIPAICYCIPTKGCLHIQRQFYMFYLKSYSNIITWLYVLKSCICFGQNGMKRLFGEPPKSDILPSTGGHVWTPQIHLLAAGFEQKSHKFICRKCLFRCVFSLMFCFFSEMNPKEILHLSNRMIVIMTDESQKWKIASLECALYIFFSFLILFILLPIVSSLISYSSLQCVLSFAHHFLFFFSHPSLFWLPVLILYLSIHVPLLLPCLSTSFYPLLLSYSPTALLSSLVLSCPHIHPASFCPCLSKECCNNRMLLHNSGHYANLSFIQCIKKCFLCQGQNKSTLVDIHNNTCSYITFFKYIYVTVIFIKSNFINFLYTITYKYKQNVTVLK